MEREAQYCTTEDGVRIAYGIQGDGPALVVCPELVEPFSLDHLCPELQEFVNGLGRGRTVIRFDMRGTGLSQRDITDFSLQAVVRDFEAVVRATKLKRIAIWAPGTSGPRAIKYAAQHPRTVSALLLCGTFARVTDALPREAILAYGALWRTNAAAAAQTWADLSHRERYPQAGVQLAAIYAQGITGDDAARVFEQSVESWDATRDLRTLRVPVLVLHRRLDPTVPFGAGQAIAAEVPGARLIPLEGDVHYSALGDNEAILRAVDDFLSPPVEAHVSTEQVTTSFRTVLFTDIVGHTEMMRRLGDDRGRDVLREHEHITRETLKEHGGAEVKTMGDGFLASFGSVTKAIDCAIALQRAFAAHSDSMPEPLHVRVGLNAGEPVEEDGDLFGSTVILASRIAAKAGADEILIPEPLRHLLSGKSYVYADRGETMLKGFEDSVRLFEVRWRE